MNHLSPAKERFCARVSKTSTCWLWMGALNPNGYGSIRDNGVSHPVHRYSYLLHGGTIEEGKQIDHLCRNRACVNPKHLEPVTIKQNVLRGIGITALQARQTHCHRGHEFTEENTYRAPNGGRTCRTCRKLWTGKYRATPEAKQRHKEYLRTWRAS